MTMVYIPSRDKIGLIDHHSDSANNSSFGVQKPSRSLLMERGYKIKNKNRRLWGYLGQVLYFVYQIF